MLRSAILAASRSTRVERLVETAPLTRDVVRRFVAGTGTDDALRVTRELVDSGLAVSLDYLGEDTLTPEQAAATKDAYLRVLKALADAGLTASTEPAGPCSPTPQTGSGCAQAGGAW
jgi:proline dehydrogenase